jgi:hypothetical protein
LIPNSSKSKSASDYYDVKIIDWGMASFVFDNRRYYNSPETQFLGWLMVKGSRITGARYTLPTYLLSGLYDILLLMNNFISMASSHVLFTPIRNIFRDMSKKLYPGFLNMEKYKGTYLWTEIIENDLLDEKMLNAEDFDKYMSNLLTTLNRYSYSFIKKTLEPFIGSLKIRVVNIGR